MKVPNINNIQIRPTDRKMKQAKRTIDSITGKLPKEMPVERNVYYVSAAESMARIKDQIQVAIDNMRGNV